MNIPFCARRSACRRLWSLPLYGRAVLMFLVATAVLLASRAGAQLTTNTYIPTNSTWKFLPGTNEASTPIDAWRFVNFDDSTWQTVSAPIHYGTNSVGGDDNIFNGTILSNMNGNYSTFFVRKTFVLTNASAITAIQMRLYSDDGFAVWINGAEVRRLRLSSSTPGTPVYYTNLATANVEALTSLITTSSGLQTNLVDGTNVICVQIFNFALTNEDIRVDPELYLVGGVNPVVTNVAPAPGTSVTNMAQITVNFSQPVYGVDAPDLRINSQAASSLIGGSGSSTYTFNFIPPTSGVASVTWANAHGITNAYGVPFVSTGAWTYAHTATPPLVQSVSPVPGSSVGDFSQVTVTFNQAVTNVDASDLLINGAPATLVSVSGNAFTFYFTRQPVGTATVTWDPNHGIRNAIGSAFDATGIAWSFSVPVSTVLLTPAANSTLASVTEVQATFNTSVDGVDAADLLVNGVPAGSVFGSGAGPYIFAFPSPATGVVQFAWAPGHGIRASSSPTTVFGGGSWNITLDPGSFTGDVIINELLAGNIVSNNVFDVDEDLDVSDWIELYNRGSNAVRLLGWSLTDDPKLPGQWVFPDVTLGPGKYMLVYATGKDRALVGGINALGRTNQLHTSFKMNTFGEYLGLYSADSPRRVISEFAPQFPEQRNEYSYGLTPTNGWRYFATPTPMAANGDSVIAQVIPIPNVNVSRGVFEQPFTLVVSCDIPDATLLYTTNGSAPAVGNGFTYTGPIGISNTTVFRVAAFRTNMLPSRVSTHTYLFYDQVLKQPALPAGYPSTWVTTVGSGIGTYPADYEMDPEIVTNAVYASMVKPALQALPALSIVMKIEDMFSSTNGIYANPSPSDVQRPLWERACSAEFMPTNGDAGFHVDCGLRLQGNGSRLPQNTSKHPMRLMFRGDYGPGKLNYQIYPDSPVSEWDSIVLRSDYNNSWNHWDNGQRARAIRVRDAFGKDSFRAMGQPVSHNRYINLFINGLYWGVYEFSERVDKTFAANYAGGQPDDYDVMASKPTEAIDGDRIAYDVMRSKVIGPASNNIVDMTVLSNYVTALQYVDITNYVDYVLLNFWAANQDWGFDGNWNAYRRRSTGSLYEYCVWDTEQYIVGTNDNRVSNTDIPSGLHTNLIRNLEYKTFFGDRVQRHLFNSGALSTNQTIPRLLARAAQVDTAMIAESARWGDNRRDVLTNWMNTSANGPYYLYDRNNFWVPELNRLLTNYLNLRNAIVLTQLRSAGLYPNVTAPTFSQHGGRVPSGYSLSVTGATNIVYFTTNGVDPRVFGTGAVANGALIYGSPIVIGSSMTVKARALSGTNWSALVEASFAVNQFGTPLAITELMYNPVGGDAYEYVELQNVGTTTLDLSAYYFDGITFVFPAGFTLTPGQRTVLGSSVNTNAFKLRYPGLAVAGWYSGALANSGERIAVLDSTGRTVVSVDYSSGSGWASAANGGGYSLEIIDPNADPDDAANWRASAVQNGSPGQANGTALFGAVRLNEVMADNATVLSTNGSFPDWIELYNSGSAATNIAGWSLSKGSNPRQYVFPANTIIPSGGYLMVWCDTLTNNAGYHTGFALSRKGETVQLYDQNTNTVDGVTFGAQITDYSIGRVGASWVLTSATPGATNVAASLAPATAISINEWLANSAPGASDWLELFNTSSNAPVAIKSLFIGTSNALFQIKSLSFIAPRGYLQLFADEQPGADHVDFKLPATANGIALYDSTGVELQRITYGDQVEGVSQGRYPDGTASFATFTGSVSPGASNYILSYTGPVLNELLARNSSIVGPFGDTPDFVEIYNPTTNTVSLAGMGLSDGSGSIKFRFGSSVSIASNGYVVVWCDGGRATLTNGPIFNSGFSLSGDSGGVYLFNSAGQLVNSVEYGLQITDMPIGLSGTQWVLLSNASPAAANGSAAILGSATNLVVNEWMANPTSGDDWLELYNKDGLPVNMAGLYLTDDPSMVGRSNTIVRPLSFIAGNGWVKFVADGNLSAGWDHVNFSLDTGGELIRIYAGDFSIIDSVSFGAQAFGVAQGRLPDGGTNIVSFPVSATPGGANYLPHSAIVVNEVLSHTDPPLEDAIELQNAGTNAVNISGWWISNSERALKKFQVPTNTVVAPGGFAVFYENQFNPDFTGVSPSFTLNSAHGDAVYVSEADGAGNLTGYRVQVSFGTAENGVSFGRFQTSTGVDFTAMAFRTFGSDSPSTVAQFRTGTGRTNGYAKVGPVIISEINYHPVNATNLTEAADEEFVELYNSSGSTVPLYDPAHATNTWKLSGGVSFTFPTNITIPAGGYYIITSFNPTNSALLTSFRARYGNNGTVVGPFSGKLSNGGDTVDLLKPDAPQTAPHPDAGYIPYILVDHVVYGDTAPWPTAADGGGASLQRLSANLYGNDPANWKAETATAGRTNSSTGNEAPFITAQPVSQTNVAGSTAVFTVVASGSPSPTYQWRHAGTNLPTATSPTLTLANVQPSDGGTYSVLVSNIAGVIVSEDVILTVLVPPSIGQQPQSATAIAGTSAQFSVAASGSGPLSYQWRKNGVDLPGANNNQLSLNVVSSSDAGTYAVVITNAAGSVTSAVVTLTVIVPPTITGQPTDATVLVNSPASFSVAASGTAPLGYQWRKNGVTIPGANGPTLTFGSAQPADEGYYSVVVTNAGGSAISADAQLVVSVAPVLGAPHPVGDGSFVFTVSGQTNRNYLIDWSANLTTWSNLGSVTLTNAASTVQDLSATNAPVRFYRARVAP